MQIYGPTHLHGSQGIRAPHTTQPTKPSAPASASQPIQDELQLSDTAQTLDSQNGLSGIRMDRVNEIRAQIADGSYETAEKMNIALDRLLDEIG